MTTHAEATPAADASPDAAQLPPNEALAAEVIGSLVEAGLVSATDGERLRGPLATGTLDGAGWKHAFENQLERTEVGDGRK